MLKVVKRYKKTQFDEVVSFKDAQNLLLDILYSFHLFCEKNDISYSLAYGSLLGAVRENNIIKWDNDIDVMMSQDQFERLKSSVNSLSDFGLSYHHYSVASSTPTNEIRIFKNGYYRIDESDGKEYMIPLCIDVFPIHKIAVTSDNSLTKKNTSLMKKLSKCKHTLYLKYVKHNSRNGLVHIIKSIIQFFLLFVSSNMIHRKIDRLVNKMYNGEKEYMLFSPCADNFECLYKSTMMAKYELHQFGLKEVLIITDSEYFLTKNYRDWSVPVDRSNGKVYEGKYIHRISSSQNK